MSKLLSIQVHRDSLFTPPQMRAFRKLHRVRPTDNLHGDQANVQPGSSAATIRQETERKIAPLLRVWLKSPWEDYQLIEIHNGLTVAGRKCSYFKMATIKSYVPLNALKTIERCSDLKHPSIAPIHDLYYFDDMLHIVGEYLELSLTELDFQGFQLEEWEIATIMTKVLDVLLYLLPKGVDCTALSMSNIRLSSKGDIKIVLDLHHYEQRHGGFSSSLLDLPVFTETLEEMMLPQYHLKVNDGKRSKEALHFLSLSVTESAETLRMHPFLTRSLPSRRLLPCVRFTLKTMRLTNIKKGTSDYEGDTKSTASSLEDAEITIEDNRTVVRDSAGAWSRAMI